MSFLAPWSTIALAAALTVPPLVALYFLKLKREVHAVPSTFLWKRAVEDLRANAPFQRLRKSLLLLLQLLILLLAAFALGRPMLETAELHEHTLIVMIDQSASMNVKEKDGLTRLDIAKEQAKLRIDNMADNARAMVISFCDRAEVVSSFDTDRRAIKRKIDAVEATQSSSHLSGAMRLAEAYAQDMIIGNEQGKDIAIQTSTAPATVYVFTDGNISDADRVRVEKFGGDDVRVVYVGTRGDNVGIVSMEARRNYDRPEVLEVAATLENFSTDAMDVEADLYVDGQHADVQRVALTGMVEGEERVGSVGVVAFDPVEFGGGGVAEVRLRGEDALAADSRAWTVIEKPRRVRVLLVSNGNVFLSNVLQTFPVDLEEMTIPGYESADDESLLDGVRSAFDVVIFDRHSTARLPQGNYFFWGGIPLIDGVEAGRTIDNEIVFNWDDTHPLLRHVAIEALFV